MDDDNQGQPLQVLWEREIDAEIVTGEAWEAVAKRGFDPPRQFAAYLRRAESGIASPRRNSKLFQSPFRAGIKLDAYQLEPLRKALLLPRVNLFIADDVGLGKTIEAGLIKRELLLRKKVREIVVSAPPSMLVQWQEELENRFGLTFEILDKEYVARVRRERGYGVNPWTTHTRFLISHRLLIDEAYTGPLLGLAGRFSQRHPGRSWTKPTTRRRPVARSTRSTRRSRGPSACGPCASSIACSCRPRRTMATRTASPPCWKSSIPSGFAWACRSMPKCWRR